MNKAALFAILFFPSYVLTSEHASRAFELARKGKWQAVYELLDEKKVDIEEDEPKEKYSLLTIATINGNTEATRELLNRGSNINRKTPITPIMGAIWRHLQQKEDTLQLIELLLEKGANPLIEDDYDRNCFVYTAGIQDAYMAETLKIMILLTKPLKYSP